MDGRRPGLRLLPRLLLRARTRHSLQLDELFCIAEKASVRLARLSKRCGAVAVQVFNSEGGVPVDLAAMSTEIFELFK